MMFFIIMFFKSFLSVAFANCELEWVAKNENSQNWMHTVADHGESENFHAVTPKWINSKQIELSCENDKRDICGKIKQQIMFKSSCSKIKIKEKIVPKTSDHDDELEKKKIWQVGLCLPVKKSDNIAFVDEKGNFNFPQIYPLKKSKLSKLELSLENTIRGMPELKKIILEDFPTQIQINLSQAPFDDIHSFSNPELKNNEMLELKAMIKVKDIPSACQPNCKKPDVTIGIPLLFFKRENRWIFFGNGRIGTCSAYSFDQNKIATLEDKMNRPFGTPINYVLYDSNYDGKIDYLKLSERFHQPGTAFIYDISREGRINFIERVCNQSWGECEIEPGC